MLSRPLLIARQCSQMLHPIASLTSSTLSSASLRHTIHLFTLATMASIASTRTTTTKAAPSQMSSQQFQIRRVAPTRFTFDDALTIGEIQYRTFQGLPFGRLYGKDNTDPQNKHHTVRSFAQFYYVLAHRPGMDMYTVYDTEECQTVAFATWRYPNYMWQALERELERDGFAFRQMSALKRAAVGFRQRMESRGRDHPFLNQRMMEYSAKHSKYHSQKEVHQEALSQMDEADIANARYPQSWMVYCMLLGVLPEYQQRGIGEMLMNGCIDHIPATQPRFGVKKGPQKFNVWSTDEGVKLYEKCGFIKTRRAVVTIDGIRAPTTDLELSRPNT